MMIAVSFMVGVVVGSLFGFLVACLCHVSGKADKLLEEVEYERSKTNP